MSNTTNFIDKQTVITAPWANDVNNFVFNGITPSGVTTQQLPAVDSISTLRTLHGSSYKAVQVINYYTGSLGGGGTYIVNSADTTSTDNGGTIIVGVDNTRWYLLTSYLTVDNFGAVGDGITDDTAAIQRAVTVGGQLHTTPNKVYKLTSTVTLAVPGTSLIGESYPNSSVQSKFILSTSTPQPLFATVGDGYSFTNLYLSAGNTAPGYICVSVGPTSGTADKDVYFTNCNIQFADSGIYSYGRGIYVENCVLASLGNGIIYDWPNPFTPGGGPDQTALTGFRGLYIRNCRIQAIAGNVLRNVGSNAANMTGLDFVGNFCDGNNGLIYGSVRNANVSGNNFINCNSIMFNLNAVDSLTITGNSFAGMYDNSGNITTPHVSDIQYFMYLNSTYSASNINVTGNTIANVYKSCFFLNGTWSNININNNIFKDILRGNNDAALSPTAYYLVGCNTVGSGLNVIGNIITTGVYSRNSFLVASGGNTITNWNVHSNQYNSTQIQEQNLGSYTPSFQGATATYGTQTATYLRVGPLWYINFNIQVTSSLSNSSTNPISVNLPFNAGATSLSAIGQVNFADSNLLTTGVVPAAYACKVSNGTIIFTDSNGNTLKYNNCNQSGNFKGTVILMSNANV